MYFRTILSGTLAVLLLSVAAVNASGQSTPTPDHGVTIQRPTARLPGVFDAATDDGSFQVAQVSDPRVGQLEEQLRTLNGTIEELNFQVLQLQEQLRKIQEDYDFRLQELEKKSDASGKSNSKVAGNTTKPATDLDTSQPSSVEDVIADDTPGATNENGSGETLGAPEKNFGVITVDKDGNVKSVESPGSGVAAGDAPPAAGTGNQNGGSIVAALPNTEDPEELYRNSYQLILSGDYSAAETGFRDHISRFPKSERDCRRAFLARRGATWAEKVSRSSRDVPGRQQAVSESQEGPGHDAETWHFAGRPQAEGSRLRYLRRGRRSAIPMLRPR